MYAKYLREREGKEVLEHEHGFTIYGYNCVPGLDFPHCYIQDNWVEPAHRKKGIARQMADAISTQARAGGFRVLVGSVDGAAKGAHESMLVLIAYGMKLYTISGTTAWFTKEI
jgi:GNAT superfamily N-acetyltransferase